ncbi:Protein phosphatase 2C [Phytophthora infestans]|uniref:protein-serine/threonine phosphatase n=1 Tax=Phytophthora infestans TaxID=4787 RepID=A0A8S9U4U1_PHYIN|nr:Protein phosphatase 2C [Phytophthora infestans]KAF4133894.1 Protein phosphatase 2C [Phytophthora infestans]
MPSNAPPTQGWADSMLGLDASIAAASAGEVDKRVKALTQRQPSCPSYLATVETSGAVGSATDPLHSQLHLFASVAHETRRVSSTIAAIIRFPKLSMGCQTSKDVLPNSPREHEHEQRPSLSQIFLHAASKQQARDESGVGARRAPTTDSHRDVFSIFGEHGMTLEAVASPSASNCSPASPSGSIFSTATTASDTERTLVLHRPAGQYFPQLRVSYGKYSDTGIRKNNEDRQATTSRKVDDDLVAFFGLYDGHGGPEVAEYLAEKLHENVYNHVQKSTNKPESARSLQPADIVLADAIRTAYAATDEEIFKQQLPSGSTAVSVVIRGSTALVSSVGDSQVVLSTNGQAKDMCIAHTPDLSSERDRILKAKGQISKGRIYGMLGVSRAFGDIDFKTGRGEFKNRFNGDLVCATPDIVVHEVKSQDEFMVLGCDGLYDVMEPQDVVNFVRAKLGLHGDVQHATEELVSHAIALGSTDNVSAIIVCFNQDEQEAVPVTPIEAAQAAEAQKKRAASAVDSV